MRLTTRVSLGLGVLTLAMAALVASEVAVIRIVAEANRRLAEGSARSLATSRSLKVLSDEMEDAARKHAVTQDPGYARQYALAAQGFSDSLGALESLGLDGAEGSALAALASAWRREGLDASGGGPATADAGGAPTSPPEEASASLAVIRSHVEALGAASRATELQLLRTTAAQASRAARTATAALLAALALALAITWYLVRDTARGLRRLADGATAIAGGDFGTRIDDARHDEFGELAGHFNRMAARLAEVDRTKQRFFTGISHDLKSPLAAVQETTKLLLEGIPGPLNDDQARLLELSHRSGERLRRMIQDVLDLASLTSPEAVYDDSPVDLGELLGDVVGRFSPRAAERDIRLILQSPDSKVLIRGDDHRLRQVVENLLENALRYAPAGDAIEVRLEPALGAASGAPARLEKDAGGSLAVVSVLDGGPGVADADKERIFEQFQRAGRSSPAVSVGGGAGLGLAICREIVRAHGGRIWVEDRTGGGSAFKFALPAAADLAPDGESRHSKGRAATTLIVLLALATFGCASSTFDREFEAGRYEEAVATFESDPALRSQERAVFRAALASADPSTPAFDPQQATTLCALYLSSWPDTERAASVGVMLRLLTTYLAAEQDRSALRIRLAKVSEQLETLKRIDLGDNPPP